MARKLEAQFDGTYLISSVLMTSTMKSEPAPPQSPRLSLRLRPGIYAGSLRDADVFVPWSSSVGCRSAGLRSTPPDSNFCVDIIVAAACCKPFRRVASVVRSLKRHCRLEAVPCCE